MELIPQVQLHECTEETVNLKQKFKCDFKGYRRVEAYIRSFTDISEKGVYEISFVGDSSFAEEEYILKIDDNVTIISNGEEGAFRAASTLKQLMYDGAVQKQEIHDFPDIKNRGLMIDISRGKIPKTETILEIIDLMADVKYNQLQLYMDGFVFEYEHFSKYCKDTCPVTKEEISRIQEYCENRFIELVPNQNGFGHMEKWLEIPEFKHLAIEDNKITTLNPLDDESIELVDRIYSDLLPYFKSKLVNVGMDEPHSLGQGQTKNVCENCGKGRVYTDYLNKILKLANEKYNKLPMFWDDIVFSHPEELDNIKSDCVVMTWGYESETPFMEKTRILKEKGLRFYVCPGTSGWLTITGRFNNMIFNIENAAKSCIYNGGEGFLLTDWGDGGHSQFLAMSILPYIYGACCSWNYKVKKTSYKRTAYYQEAPIIKYCEDFADSFVFKSKGMARLLHKMANYYLLENSYIINSTKTFEDLIYNICRGGKSSVDIEDMYAVEEYMEHLRKQLNEFDGGTPYLEETKCNYDMVICFAKTIIAWNLKSGNKIADDELKRKVICVREDFNRNWIKKNRPVGNEIFDKNFSDIIDLFE